MSSHPAAWAFLADERARKIAAAWPSVFACSPAARWVAWARASGLDLFLVRRIGQVLLDAGICEPDGKLSGDTAQFIRGQAARGLRVARRPRQAQNEQP